MVIFTKKDSNVKLKSSAKPVVITLLILAPLLLLFTAFALYMLDNIVLHEDVNFIYSVLEHKSEIPIISICLWAIAFYYMIGAMKVSPPKDSSYLTKTKWASVDEQKEMFEVAPLDTTAHLKVGGAPINRISDHEILYEKYDMHDLCLGATRSGKSRKIVRQLVMLASMADEAMIFNDPKKEMYQDFHEYLENKGYEVKCVDFRNPQYSDRWNPMEAIVYQMELGNTDDAEQYAEDQVTSLVVDNGVGEKIWIDGQKALIKSLILAVADAPIPKSKKNYYSVYQTLAELGEEIKIDRKDQMVLSAYMLSLEEGTPSRKSFAPIRVSPDKTRGSFVTSALATLEKFTGQKIARILSESDFDFHTYVNGRKALFVVNPDEKNTYNPIAAMLYSSAYQTMIFEANKMKGRKLEKRVHFILDEFGNMPKIDDIDKLFTVSLSRSVLFHIYLQDFKQLNKTYGADIPQILRSNCGIWYFISSNDTDVCEEMSKKVGNTEVWVPQVSASYDNKQQSTGSSVSYSVQKKPLIDADELMHGGRTDGNGIIVSRQDMDPCKVYLPDCSQYPWYKEMKHDEKEVLKDQKPPEYAIPRYLNLSRTILFKAGVKMPIDNRTTISSTTSKREEPLMSSDMYWYWSTRDDLEGVVFGKVIEYLRSVDLYQIKGSVRKFIQNYMKSDDFIQWLWSIDVKDSDMQIDDIKEKIDEKEKYDSAFSDAWS